MNRLQRLFPTCARSRRLVVCDGACGTELIGLGLKLGESADLWNLSRPEAVEAVARAYVAAGAEVLLTNTFLADPVMLKLAHIGAIEVNRRGVEIARQAARAAPDRAVRVFGSIGPAGGARAVDAFAFQAEALADAGADALVFETLCTPEEARDALAAAAPTGLPVVVSFHFRLNPDPRAGAHSTLSGATPEAVARVVREAGGDAIGANCGDGIERLPELCRLLRDASGLPVWIKPNAGTPIIENGRSRCPIDPRAFAAIVPALADAGAAFIGGCCGAGPEHVRALALARDQIP